MVTNTEEVYNYNYEEEGDRHEKAHQNDIGDRRHPYAMFSALSSRSRLAWRRLWLARRWLGLGLGALDAKLRRQLQTELKALQQRVGITFVYVTHDQEEALTMSDRIAVMSHGIVEQIGTPREVYDEPTTEFVADFLCISNIISGEAQPDPGGGCRLSVGEFTLIAKVGETSARGTVKCVVRPERVKLEPYDSTGENRVPGIVEHLVYLEVRPAWSCTLRPATRSNRWSRPTLGRSRISRNSSAGISGTRGREGSATNGPGHQENGVRHRRSAGTQRGGRRSCWVWIDDRRDRIVTNRQEDRVSDHGEGSRLPDGQSGTGRSGMTRRAMLGRWVGGAAALTGSAWLLAA